MERFKKWWGRRCELNPNEVESCLTDPELNNNLKVLGYHEEPVVTFDVPWWSIGNNQLMRAFMKGLKEYGFETYDVIKVGKTEIRKKAE